MKSIEVLATALALGLGAPALAVVRDVTVQVDAAAGPWSTASNAKLMPYGAGNEKPAVILPFDIGGGKISIIPDGTTGTRDAASVPPEGIVGKAVDDTLGHRKKRYPSFYTPKVMYPAYRHALVAAFVNDKGIVVGRAFVVGQGVRVPIPENAAALSFGFNDVDFSGNTGSLKVTVELPY